ncbi:peptide chain release factor N(5)-glutamine methyltransferase [candidate division KSB1 bacterium]|nr:peptide chain release factor N(5)-glutamine methyltransferase [candidate division KSB1 bacterium]
MAKKPLIRLSGALNDTVKRLERAGIPNPRGNAERLMGYVLKMKRADLYLNFNRTLKAKEIRKLNKGVSQRLAHRPLQYILGETEFFSLPFKVGEGVLIPRPDTEILVEKVVEYAQGLHCAQGDGNLSILDIGSGCGNITISLAKNLDRVQVLAVDIYRTALRFARKNSRLNGTVAKVHFKRWNIFNERDISRLPGLFDLIVSNPPYVTEGEYKTLSPEIRDYEPKGALVAGGDGLLFFKRIADLSPSLLKSEGWLFLEIGIGQAPRVREMMKDRFGGIRVYQDYTGHDRVIVGRLR